MNIFNWLAIKLSPKCRYCRKPILNKGDEFDGWKFEEICADCYEKKRKIKNGRN